MAHGLVGASLFVLLLGGALPAAAADAIADPATPVGKAGKVILDAVGGQSYADAFARTRSPVNPFGIDVGAAAAAAGATSPSGDSSGAIAAEGGFSILPQFNTPEQKFASGAATPAIIPFAFMTGGACQGGYASGNPTADKVFALDMTGRECSAVAVDKAVGAEYPLAVAEAAAPAEAAATATADGATKVADSPAAPTADDAAAPAADATPTPATVPAAGAAAPAPGASDAAPAADAATAAAFDGPADDVGKVGQVILATVAGRTVQQALDAGGEQDNPFGLDADPLLLAAGVYFISNNSTGAPIEKSEFSIYPDYVTPGDKYDASAQTPAIMPFAFNRGGTCFGGYITGYPVPDTVKTVDMTGKDCNAKTIDDVVGAQYQQIAASTPAPDASSSNDAPAANDQQADDSPKPADAGTTAAPADTGTTAAPSSDSAAPATDDTGTDNSSSGAATGADDAAADNSVFDGTSATDHDLEMIVYGAYTGAYNQALKHDNYFNSADFDYPALRSAMLAALEKEGYGAATVAPDPVDTTEEAKACTTDGSIALRVSFNGGGTGVSVVAVSGTRMSAYEYDPSKSTDLAITHADDCLAAGSAPAADSGATPDRLSTPAH